MKQQVVMIFGGSTFDSYQKYFSALKKFKLDFDRIRKIKWNRRLQESLGNKFEVVYLTMPNRDNAKYREWKIWFKKLEPYLRNGVILVGHSLGAIFLTKYLSENNFTKKIKATFLVGAPFDAQLPEKTLADFVLPKSLAKLQRQGGKIYFYQSLDDKVVPFSHFKKYKKHLPKANFIVFKDRGHFGQEKFSEIIKEIKKITK